MRMYTLWKFDPHNYSVARLEHDGIPVLFEQVADAEAYGQKDPEVWEAELQVFPVTVGRA